MYIHDAYLKAGSRNKVIQATLIDNFRRMESDLLLERAQKLDPQALSQIHDRFYPAVYRYVKYRLGDEQLVEDISSEVFLRLINHLHHQSGEIHSLRAWLFGTAANLVNDHLRQKYRRPVDNLSDHENLATHEDPAQSAEQNDHNREVRRAMKQLTREQQHVLTLRFSQGLSIEETANLMEKSVGAVKTLQFRAVATLRKLLEISRKV